MLSGLMLLLPGGAGSICLESLHARVHRHACCHPLPHPLNTPSCIRIMPRLLAQTHRGEHCLHLAA
jgi:hypothetical protein